MTEPATGWYCTGRGSHDYAIVSPGFLVWPPGRTGGPLPAVLRCPVCGLAKRLGWKARQRLAGSAEVDISTLPF